MADQSRDALDRYWDDLVRGRPSTPTSLDPTLADAVRTFHAARDVGGPSPAFVARLQEELMPTDTATLADPLVARTYAVPNGRVGSSSRAPRFDSPVPARRPGWLASLSFAVVAVVALVIGSRALTEYDDGGSGLGGIPAVVVRDGKPLPNGVTDVESLVEVAIPDGLIAAGARTDLALMLHEVPPGTTMNEGIDPTGCCPGLNIVHVLTGAATVRADGPMQLLPKVGGLEPIVITAGTDVPLAPGDTLLYRQEVTWEWTVTDAGPMEVLLSVALGGIYGSFWNTFSGHPVDSRVEDSLSFPTSDYPIRLWRATLAPDATLQPSEGVVQLAVSPSAGTARISDLGGYAVRNRGDEAVTLYLMSVGSPDRVTAEQGADTTLAQTDATPAPPGVTGDQTLVEVTLPADVLAKRDAAEVNMALFTVPAGSTTTWTGADPACCAGQAVMHVIEGTSVFTPGAPVSILRAGAQQPEAIAPGVAVDVAPGDTVLAREELPWVWTVDDAAPMRLLASWVLVGTSMSSPDQAAWINETYEGISFIALPAEPLTLQLRRLTLDAGATLPAGSAVVQVAMGVPDLDARLATLGDGGVKNLGDGPADLYVLTLTPAGPDATVVVTGTVASHVAATPGTGTTVGNSSLVEIAMAGGMIAAGEPTDFALMRYTLPGGMTSRPANTDFNGCCPGLNIVHVLEGTATVRGDRAMQLRRHVGGPESEVVTADTDVAIEPGDTLLVDEGTTTDWTVADGGTTSLLWGLVLGGTILDPPFGGATWVLEDAQFFGTVPFPTEPYTIRLWPTTLAPGASLEPEAGTIQLLVAAPSQSARLAEREGRIFRNLGDQPVALYVMTLSTTDPGSSSPVGTPSPTSSA